MFLYCFSNFRNLKSLVRSSPRFLNLFMQSLMLMTGMSSFCWLEVEMMEISSSTSVSVEPQPTTVAIPLFSESCPGSPNSLVSKLQGGSHITQLGFLKLLSSLLYSQIRQAGGRYPLVEAHRVF